MTIIVCVDNRMGMMFNHRRQSRDRVLAERLLSLCEGHTLRLHPYSSPLFPEGANIAVSEDFLSEAGEDDICFVEDPGLLPGEGRIRRIVLCRWNRDYPADGFFPLSLINAVPVRTEEFPGSSHERITLEEYAL